MKKEEIKIEDFLNERTEDIQKLEKAINGSKKSHYCFKDCHFIKEDGQDLILEKK